MGKTLEILKLLDGVTYSIIQKENEVFLRASFICTGALPPVSFSSSKVGDTRDYNVSDVLKISRVVYLPNSERGIFFNHCLQLLKAYQRNIKIDILLK